ncbi:E motif [Dillenia turbinata]|uniref:E motif n=1 Tax=Dillenia turbinata TaxID=194707 RepID=A0AAN8ZSJ4_9MAGN
MGSVPLPPSGGKIRDSFPTMKTNSWSFAQIPSWVSLKAGSSNSNQKGRVENLHLILLTKQGKLKEAQEFIKEMDDAGVSLSPNSYKCLFEAFGVLRSLSDGRFFHRRLDREVKNPWPHFLENSVLQFYCDCASFSDAEKLFNGMQMRSLTTWAILIDALVREGLVNRAFLWLSRSAGLDMSVYVRFLRSLSSPSYINLGKEIHAHLIKAGLTSTVPIDSALLIMYVKCVDLESAELVFQQMAEKDAVDWTALMVGYTQSGKLEEAVSLFARMVNEGIQLDEYVFSIVLKACTGMGCLNMGRQIHGIITKKGLASQVYVGTPLLDFYAKCASIETACQAFKVITEPNDASWSSLMSAYAQAGQFEECVKIFRAIRSVGFFLNPFIYTTIFQACSAMADLNSGAQAHADAIKRGLISYLHGESAMITMYSKCGQLEYAFRAFDSIDEPDTLAWTALICACAHHGNGAEALNQFRRMEAYGARPNNVTLIAVLTACSHSGLVSEAEMLLDSMSSKYGVDPTIDHYDCMIDVYSRAGLLEEALALVNNMPFEPDAMSWKSLLGGCQIHKNLAIAKVAAENLLQLDQGDTAGYVIMFNLYASSGRWKEAAHFRKLMAEANLRKEVSCSWIPIKGKVHRFIVGDRHHPQTQEIYSKLGELEASAFNDSTDLIAEKDLSYALPERKEQLLVHTEIANFGMKDFHFPEEFNVPSSWSSRSMLVILQYQRMLHILGSSALKWVLATISQTHSKSTCYCSWHMVDEIHAWGASAWRDG